MPDGSDLNPQEMPLRDTVAPLKASKIVELWEMGYGRENLIPLYVGEGDLPTPDFICDAAHEAMRAGHTFYGPKRGIGALRRALVDYKKRHFSAELELERVTVTSSGMSGIVMALQAVVSQGDNLVLVSPCWPNVVASLKVLGGEPRPVQLEPQPDGGFKLDLERLFDACDARTRAIFVVSPSNPTGWIISPEEQEALLAFCRERRIWLLADEVYHRFVYDRPVAPSFLQLARPDDPLIVLNSFSKAWAMTGWRMGWLVHPVSLAETFNNLIEFNTSGAPPFLQYGCVTALEEGEPFVTENVARCGRAAEVVYQSLSELPRLRIARPKGSFYSFFGVEGLTDSLAFCKEVLSKTGVGLAPGAAFGPGGEGHIRLCFANSPDVLAEAMDRIAPLLR